MMNKALLQCIQKREKNRPLWMFRQAGRYLPEYRELRKKEPDFMRFCYSPDYCIEAVLQPIKRFDLDVAIVFSDILVIPDVLGQKVRFDRGDGPRLEPLNSGALISNLCQKSIFTYLKPVYEAVSGMAEALGERDLIGFSGSPWTLACYMIEGQGSRDFFSARKAAISDPTFPDLMKLLEDKVVEHLSCQIEAGASVVQLFDSWSGILSPEMFVQYVVDPTKRIVSALKLQYPQVPVMGFARGSGEKIKNFAENSFVDVVTLDETMQRSFLKTNEKYVLQGNLDPAYLLGSKEILEREVSRWKSDTEGQAWIYNLGHGIHKDTDPEMVQQMIDYVRAS